jgi:hypothetical protein
MRRARDQSDQDFSWNAQKSVAIVSRAAGVLCDLAIGPGTRNETSEIPGTLAEYFNLYTTPPPVES